MRVQKLVRDKFFSVAAKPPLNITGYLPMKFRIPVMKVSGCGGQPGT